jgi:hypothetical protein
MNEDEKAKDTVASEGDERTVNNTVRHQYRVLTDAEKAAMLAVKDAGQTLIDAIESLAPSRERSLAVTKAEEAVMWAVKGITK